MKHMHRFSLRIVGGLLLFAALLGAAISIIGMVVLWRLEPVVNSTTVETIDLMERTFTVSRNLLDVSAQTLNDIEKNITQIHTSLEDATTVLQSTSTSASALAKIVGDDLPGVVGKTQTALGSMQKSAKLMDDTLTLISRIPFVGAPYRNDVPLQDSVAQVSKSLDTIPADLKTMQTQLTGTAASFESLQKDTARLSEDIGAIEKNLADAKKVVNDYQSILDDSQHRLDQLRGRVSGWILLCAWMGTVFLVWLLLAQFALFAQGLEMITRKMVIVEASEDK
jgi:uncharacterized protein YoxC